MEKQLGNILKIMSYGLSGRNVGVPISAIVVDGESYEVIVDGKADYIKFHNIKLKKSNSKNRLDNFHHAEHLCLSLLKKNRNNTIGNLIMFTTIPPCKKCLMEIRDSKMFKKIYYLINDGQEKKQYINDIASTGKNLLVEYLDLNCDDYPEIYRMKKKFFSYKRFVYNNNKWRKIWDSFK